MRDLGPYDESSIVTGTRYWVLRGLRRDHRHASRKDRREIDLATPPRHEGAGTKATLARTASRLRAPPSTARSGGAGRNGFAIPPFIPDIGRLCSWPGGRTRAVEPGRPPRGTFLIGHDRRIRPPSSGRRRGPERGQARRPARPAPRASGVWLAQYVWPGRAGRGPGPSTGEFPGMSDPRGMLTSAMSGRVPVPSWSGGTSRWPPWSRLRGVRQGGPSRRCSAARRASASPGWSASSAGRSRAGARGWRRLPGTRHRRTAVRTVYRRAARTGARDGRGRGGRDAARPDDAGAGPAAAELGEPEGGIQASRAAAVRRGAGAAVREVLSAPRASRSNCSRGARDRGRALGRRSSRDLLTFLIANQRAISGC